jgi:carboxyl-terminal processing protease
MNLKTGAKIVLISALTSHTFNIQAQTKNQDNYFELSKNLDIYYALFKEVNQYYVDGVQPGKMVKTSIDAMLDNLDPYTNYITEDDIEDYRFQTTGKYGGIGSSLRPVGDYIVVEEPYEGSPATKAGLKSGDIIIEIDGKSIKGFKEDDVRKLVKGSAGTPIKFKIRDPFTNAETVKTFNREEININNITHSALMGANKDLAYVRLNQFTERAAVNVKAALDSLKKTNPNMKGVILDLRYNPGGLLDEAVSLCNLFLNRDQLVVSTRGKVEEWVKEYKTTALAWDEKIPIAILVNKGSASASEIVSGTLQDLDRGVVVGQRSYGKGLVQTTRNLPFNAKIKVTTAKYYTPSGRCIQALDYAHRNDDGSVGEIADSVKKEFKTKLGRKVYDGGGIDPDIKTIARESSKLVTTLYTSNLIFEYANKYAHDHATIAPAATYALSDAEVDAFITWVQTKEYSYKTKTEEALDKMKAIAEKENYYSGVKTEYDALAKALSHDKKMDLQKNKKEIKRILQTEIVARYYYQKGKATNEMQDDDEVKEAVNILSDVARYNKILGLK